MLIGIGCGDYSNDSSLAIKILWVDLNQIMGYNL